MTVIDVRKRRQIQTAYAKGMPTKDILEKFDICKSTLYNYLKPKGKRRGRQPTVYGKGVRDAIATLNYRGYSDRKIAKSLGLGKTQVSVVRKSMGLPEIGKGNG